MENLLKAISELVAKVDEKFVAFIVIAILYANNQHNELFERMFEIGFYFYLGISGGNQIAKSFANKTVLQIREDKAIKLENGGRKYTNE